MLSFATSISSILAHVETHKRHETIKIWKCKNSTDLRPNEHAYDHTTGKCFGGSDAKQHLYKFDASVIHTSAGDLICPQCSDKIVKFSHADSFQKKSKRVSKFDAHVAKCKNKTVDEKS